MTHAQIFIDQLKNGYCPTAEEIKDLCYSLHNSMCDKDMEVMLWLPHSFEFMGDDMVDAMNCCGDLI